MKIKQIKEVFNDYKKTSLLIATEKCNFKCEKEGLCPLGSCQNSELIKSKTVDMHNSKIIKMFNENELVEALIIGGLEPFLQFDEVYDLLKEFRKTNSEDFLVYTGYYKNEILDKINKLKEFDNVIVKFGRFVANSDPIYDETLGVTLVSSNQYAEKIS